MWAARYFAPRYWAARFWSKVGATAAPDETQDALRGMTLSGGTQRRTDVIGDSSTRGATITPGSVRRAN